MELHEVRALYDKEQRIEVDFPEIRREVTPLVVRHISTSQNGDGFIIYSRLDRSNVEQAIQDEVDYFEAIGQDFEWKVYDYDNPPDLKERLAGHGFECGEAEAIMVLDIQAAPAILLEPVSQDIRRITNPAKIEDVIAVEWEVWDEDYTRLGQFLSESLARDPEHLSIYVAYHEEEPVSCGWMFFHRGSQFASLWGGSTLREYRGQGLYTALLATRLQEAMQRQVRFLTVDASPMSRPILEKYGFQRIAFSYPCRRRAGQEQQRG